MKIAIIGGGASGLMAASYISNHAFKNSISIDLYDTMPKLGNKILATGNGRCNLTNINMNAAYYNNEDFVSKVFEKVDYKDVIKYFNKLGLYITIDSEGRVYPYSNSSKSVLDILISSIKNTKVYLDFNVSNVSFSSNNSYIINKTIYDKVILASGSKSYYNDKKSELINTYLSNLNLDFTKTYPSLCGLKVREQIKDLFGLRIKAKVSLVVNKTVVYSEFGEVQFKKDGVSGIVIMNISNIYNKLERPKNAVLEFDFLEDFSRYNSSLIDYNNLCLEGLINEKLINYIRKYNLDIYKTLKSFKLNVLDTYDFQFSQVTYGGLSLEEVSSNFELKKYKNMYAAGEILDVCGMCGGYNLTFAFVSAIVISRSICSEIKNK